ncbi:MAG TPA: SDR family oxidoreductase [Marmoricola sp.]|nr:SDR family oxidoreductase [Marmoricola sp.]
MRVAMITGGSAGLGRALLTALVLRGWTVVTDGRSREALAAVAGPQTVVVAGDVADPAHRRALVAEVTGLGRLDLLVHNASTLGPLPMRRLRDLGVEGLRETWEVNVAAPYALTRALLPQLQAHGGGLLSLSSDAAVEHYAAWGAYGASKAALDHLTLTWAAEEGIDAWVVDPGDMRTRMHQDAFPGEDISDRPLPGTVVPHLLALIDRRPPAGRYRAADIPLDGPRAGAAPAVAGEVRG